MMMTDVLKALFYLSTSRTLRKAAGILGSPWRIVAACAAVALYVVLLQHLTLNSDGQQLSHVTVSVGAVGMALALCLTGVMATFQSPIRLTSPDVTWIVTIPNGSRALIAHRLIMAFAMGAALGMVPLATNLFAPTDWATSWGIPLVAGIGTLLLRTVSYATHLAEQIIHSNRVLRTAWILAALSTGIDIWGLTSGAETTLTPLAGFTFIFSESLTTRANHAGALTIITGVLIFAGFALSRLLPSRMEPTVKLTWELDHIMNMFHDVRRSPSALTELVGVGLRTGLKPLTTKNFMKGELAFAWRALAHTRRSTPPAKLLGHCLPLIALGCFASLAAPAELIAAPLALATIINTFSGSITGLADECDRPIFRLAPGSSILKAFSATAVPALEGVISTLSAGIPIALFTNDLDTADRLAIIGISITLAAMSTIIASSAALLAHSMASRLLSTILMVTITVTLASLPSLAGLPAWTSFFTSTIILLATWILTLAALAHHQRL